jgi:hypothetical protein
MVARCRHCDKSFVTFRSYLARRPNGGFCSNACWSAFLEQEPGRSIWDRTVADPETGCWEWQGALKSAGYPSLNKKVAGRVWQYGHQLAFFLAHGPIPDGKWVLHKCGNARCINPDHLYAGTPIDNARDRDRMGRNGSAKLTPDLVASIKELLARGATEGEVALAYNVQAQAIHCISVQRTWQWVEYSDGD